MKPEKFREKSAVEQLLALVTMLRDREFGCPWDLQQSIQSLIPHTLEEVYEVVDAIENQDMAGLENELGDLLFQVVFYAQIAREQALFTFDDVARVIVSKLIRRHPHVFADGRVENFGRKSDISADQVVVNWEAIKQQEKAQAAPTEPARATRATTQPCGVLDDVPLALPALERARKLQKRAATVGFDWPSLAPVVAGLKEEIAELEHALDTGNTSEISAELGDVLFAAVNLARHVDVQPESALRGANRRFEQRFRWIEQALREQDKQVGDVELDELDRLWDEAKQADCQ